MTKDTPEGSIARPVGAGGLVLVPRALPFFVPAYTFFYLFFFIIITVLYRNTPPTRYLSLIGWLAIFLLPIHKKHAFPRQLPPTSF